MSAYDLLIIGGTIVDGTGGAAYRADVGVRGATIEAIGDLDGSSAATVVDARDRLVMPGFIDAHVHADAVLPRSDVQLAMLRQGVTTVILGQDGLSFAPGSAATVDYVTRYFAAVAGTPPPELLGPDGGCTVAGLLSFYDRRTPINVAYLVPLGTVRHEVLGAEDRPAGDRLGAMQRLVEQGLEEGAVGVSTGLEYVPGVFADLDELAALCRPAARVGAPYVSHLRSYDGGTAPGMDEARTLGEVAEIPIHVSHYRGRAEPLLAHLARCEATGVDVTFDAYPHVYGNTILAMRALRHGCRAAVWTPRWQGSGMRRCVRSSQRPGSRPSWRASPARFSLTWRTRTSAGRRDSRSRSAVSEPAWTCRSSCARSCSPASWWSAPSSRARVETRTTSGQCSGTVGTSDALMRSTWAVTRIPEAGVRSLASSAITHGRSGTGRGLRPRGTLPGIQRAGLASWDAGSSPKAPMRIL